MLYFDYFPHNVYLQLRVWGGNCFGFLFSKLGMKSNDGWNQFYWVHAGISTHRVKAELNRANLTGQTISKDRALICHQG